MLWNGIALFGKFILSWIHSSNVTFNQFTPIQPFEANATQTIIFSTAVATAHCFSAFRPCGQSRLELSGTLEPIPFLLPLGPGVFTGCIEFYRVPSVS